MASEKISFEEFAEENFKELIKALEDKEVPVEEKIGLLQTTLFDLLDFLGNVVAEENNKEKAKYIMLKGTFYGEDDKLLGNMISVAFYDKKLIDKIVEKIEEVFKN